MIDAIHIGDYKTATTWLQKAVFQPHPELMYIDDPGKYPQVAQLFYELVDARDLDFDAASLRDRFRAEIERCDPAGRKVVVSREALSGQFLSGDHAGRIAERLFQVFGPTRILMVFREQFSMLASMYSEYLKSGGTLSLVDFVWDPIVSPNLISRLQYHRNVQAFTDIFGAANVSVRLFEELKHDPNEFLHEIFAFIGCGFYCRQSEGSIFKNRSLTTVGVVAQRVVNRFVRTHLNPSANLVPLDRIIASLLSEAQKDRLLLSAMIQLPRAPIAESPRHYLLYAINMALNLKLSQWCEAIRLGGSIEIPRQLRERLTPHWVTGNRLLARDRGLDLHRHGWSL